MVTCNICRENLPLEEIEPGFRYVCKECWRCMKITILSQEVDKSLIY